MEDIPSTPAESSQVSSARSMRRAFQSSSWQNRNFKYKNNTGSALPQLQLEIGRFLVQKSYAKCVPELQLQNCNFVKVYEMHSHSTRLVIFKSKIVYKVPSRNSGYKIVRAVQVMEDLSKKVAEHHAQHHTLHFA